MSLKMSPPLVSVCIQTFQQAYFIRDCLDSVVKQETNFPFEIIIGEDESNDGTREICLEYEEKYPQLIRLFLRSEKDKIYVDGEKTGRFNFIENLKAAQGKYIATLDGDDFWVSLDKLQRQVEFMESNETCSLSFHSTTELKPGSYEIEKVLPGSPKFFPIEEILMTTGRLTLHTSNVMFRRNAIQNIPDWFYYVPFLDVPLFTYTGSQGVVGFVPGLLSVYRIHKKGMWLSREEPFNYIKQWRMFSIMCENFEGELREVLISRRRQVGISLIRFYRRHRWYHYGWLKDELAGNKFESDAELARIMVQPLHFKEYLFNIGSFSKRIIQKLVNKIDQ